MTPEKLDELEDLARHNSPLLVTFATFQDLIAAARREAALRERLAKAARIIEDADRLAEAADGPVLHVRDTMTDREWRELYLLLSEVPQQHQSGDAHEYDLRCKVCSTPGTIRVSIDPPLFEVPQ